MFGVLARGDVRRHGRAAARGTAGGGPESVDRLASEGSSADGLEAVEGYARAHADSGRGGGDFGNERRVRTLRVLDGDVRAVSAEGEVERGTSHRSTRFGKFNFDCAIIERAKSSMARMRCNLNVALDE